MSVPEKAANTRSCLLQLIFVGLLFVTFGGFLIWSLHSAETHEKDLRLWVNGEASLDDVGISKVYGKHHADYFMTARYHFSVDGRVYEGSQIREGSSNSAAEVRSWVIPFAPQAAEVDLKTLVFPKQDRTWPVASRSVPVRYDPHDPGRSHLMLPHSTAFDSRRSGISIGIIAMFIVSGIGLLILSWLMWRGEGKEEAEQEKSTGPAMRG